MLALTFEHLPIFVYRAVYVKEVNKAKKYPPPSIHLIRRNRDHVLISKKTQQFDPSLVEHNPF